VIRDGSWFPGRYPGRAEREVTSGAWSAGSRLTTDGSPHAETRNENQLLLTNVHPDIAPRHTS
jgi:hypothetical protein